MLNRAHTCLQTLVLTIFLLLFCGRVAIIVLLVQGRQPHFETINEPLQANPVAINSL